MPESTQAISKSRRRWLRIALVVSLILNLLFVGLVLGAAAGKRRYVAKEGIRDERALSHLGPYGRALPQVHRDALVTELRPAPGDIARVRRELREGFQEFLGVLREETFDADAAAALMEKQQSLVSGQAGKSQDAFIDVLKSMTLEERRSYADDLRKTIRRGPSPERGPSEGRPPKGGRPPSGENRP